MTKFFHDSNPVFYLGSVARETPGNRGYLVLMVRRGTKVRSFEDTVRDGHDDLGGWLTSVD